MFTWKKYVYEVYREKSFSAFFSILSLVCAALRPGLAPDSHGQSRGSKTSSFIRIHLESHTITPCSLIPCFMAERK